MLEPLASLDEGTILDLLADEYGCSADALTFAPLGEDSWCYRAGDHWVSVRRDLRGHVPAAYTAAAQLRDQGANFVLAPLRGTSGAIVHWVDAMPIVVFPYFESTSFDGAVASSAEKRRVVAMLRHLHRSMVDAAIGTETFDLPFADELTLVERIASGQQPEGGRYAKPLSRLLCAHRECLLEWRAEYEALAERFRQRGFPVQVTHGEPLASNILRTRRGLMLADWGELMHAPAERDWSHVWRTLNVRPSCEPEMLRLYDLRWRLSEIGEYTTVFSNPHTGDIDDAAMWKRLTRYLPVTTATRKRAVAR